MGIFQLFHPRDNFFLNAAAPARLIGHSVGLMASSVCLRPACREDARELLVWRNDPSTRAQSRHGEEIGWDDHCRWLLRTLDDADCLLLIGTVAGQRIGMVRFNRDQPAGWWEVSIALAPSWRGRGWGGRMLAAGIGQLRKNHPGVEVLAAVRPGNGASENLFLHAGFEAICSDEDFAHFLLRA